jgi:hypothetical protein
MRAAHLADGTAHPCAGGHGAGEDNMRLSWNYLTYSRTGLHIAAECTGRTDLVAPFRRVEKAPA